LQVDRRYLPEGTMALIDAQPDDVIDSQLLDITQGVGTSDLIAS